MSPLSKVKSLSNIPTLNLPQVLSQDPQGLSFPDKLGSEGSA